MDDQTAKFYLEGALNEDISKEVDAEAYSSFNDYADAVRKYGRRMEGHKTVVSAGKSFGGSWKQTRSYTDKVVVEPASSSKRGVRAKKCTTCGRNSHDSGNCWAKSKIKCYACGESGHMAKDCRSSAQRKTKKHFKKKTTVKKTKSAQEDEYSSENSDF